MKKLLTVSLFLSSLCAGPASYAAPTLETIAPVENPPTSLVPEIGEVVYTPENSVGLIVKKSIRAKYHQISYVGLNNFYTGTFQSRLGLRRGTSELPRSNVRNVDFSSISRTVYASSSGLKRGDRVTKYMHTGTVYFVFKNDKVLVKWTDKESLSLDRFSFFEVLDLRDLVPVVSPVEGAVQQEGVVVQQDTVQRVSMPDNTPYTQLPAGTRIKINQTLASNGGSVIWFHAGKQYLSIHDIGPDSIYCALVKTANYEAGTICPLGPLNHGTFEGDVFHMGLACYNGKGGTVSYADLLRTVGGIVEFIPRATGL